MTKDQILAYLVFFRASILHLVHLPGKNFFSFFMAVYSRIPKILGMHLNMAVLAQDEFVSCKNHDLEKKINVLSLFDGISAGRIALERANIEVGTYHRAEVDKYVNLVAMYHYPNDVQLGDVTKWREWKIDWSSIDLLIGGSPCQGFSFAGKQLAFDDPRSKLFFEFVDILNHIRSFNPNVKFMLENVKMKKEFIEVINEKMGVSPVIINSALVSAQNRVRLYWCNWKVNQPDDKGILLSDVLEYEVDSQFNLSEQRQSTISESNRGGNFITHKTPKVGTLCAGYHKTPTDGYYVQVPPNTVFKKNYAQFDINNTGYGSQGQRAYYPEGKHGTLACSSDKAKVLGGAIRGRFLIDGVRQDHKGKTAGKTEQRLEIRDDGKTNTLTTVQKDNVVVYQNLSATGAGKSYALTHSYNGAVAENSITRRQRTMVPVGESNIVSSNVYQGILYRKLTPIECERLQTFPDNYTSLVSKTQRYKALGNSWTVDVISHIFLGLKGKYEI